MQNFVIGDIQGCYKGLRKLLKKVGFEPYQDKLWAVGDLVARGPQSLETLAFLRDLGPHFDSVLGNHDIHLIAIAFGAGKVKAQDKLEPLLKHPEFNQYIDWLRSKPLAHKPAKGILISHAGLFPQWSIKQARKLSGEVNEQLNSAQASHLLHAMYGNTPSHWDEKLQGNERYRFIINAFTRMRYLQKGGLELKSKCHPSLAAKNLTPWFECQNDQLKTKQRVIFGHWASLLGETHSSQFIGLDTGYVWGKTLTLYSIENNRFFSVNA